MEKNEHKSIKQIQTENQGHLIFGSIIQDKIKLDQKLFIFVMDKESNLQFLKNHTSLNLTRSYIKQNC